MTPDITPLFEEVEIYPTPDALPASGAIGKVAIVGQPLTLYFLAHNGWQVLSSGANPPAPTPASESGLGTVELATEAEVQAGTAGVLVATVARLKAEFDRRVPAASQTVAGIVELATSTETSTGTDTTRAIHSAGFKAAITPEAWIAPTLQNSWINHGAPNEVAGYRKLPWGTVELRGTLKSGTTTANTVLFNLPSGYRPANTRRFPAVQGGAASCLLLVAANGDVTIQGVTDNAYLTLDSVRFDV